MSEMSATPFVSIVVPCFNEAACIEECLASILSQEYPAHRMEVLIADGRSTDGTRDLIERYANAHREACIRIVDNPDRIQAAGCNRAITVSRGDIIIRMDAHAKYQPDYVKSCVNALMRSGALIVGGAQRPVWRTPFQRAMIAALASPLAVGGAAYRNPNREGFVDTVWLGAFHRNAFEDVGLFDPRAVTNEDAELNHRVSRSGGKIYLSRDIVGYYYPRENLRALARQYFRYGVGRARTTLKHRRLQTFRPLAPVTLVLGFLGLAIAASLSQAAEPVLAATLILYLCSLILEATRIGIRHGLALIPDVLAILPTIHFAWGTGFLYGLARYALRPDWEPPPLRLPRRYDGDERAKRA